MRTAQHPRSQHAFTPTALDHLSLETRDLMAVVVGPVSHPVKAEVSTPTPVMTNATENLNLIYNDFVQGGESAAQLSTQFPSVLFQGNSVGITVKVQGNFNSALSELESLGLSVTVSSSANDLIQGFAPITELPAIAGVSQSVASTPRPQPRFFRG